MWNLARRKASIKHVRRQAIDLNHQEATDAGGRARLAAGPPGNPIDQRLKAQDPVVDSTTPGGIGVVTAQSEWPEPYGAFEASRRPWAGGWRSMARHPLTPRLSLTPARQPPADPCSSVPRYRCSV